MKAPVARAQAVAIAVIVAAGSAYRQVPLTEGEIAVLDAGRQIVREERVSNSAWPRVTILQFIPASPLDAAAVFADYGRHATYLPGLKRATVSARPAPTVAEVDYLLNVPLFPDEAYTVRDSASRSDDGRSYLVEWQMVRARSTKAIVGSARFEPYRNARTAVDGTLLTYDNLVIPGQALAGPLKGRALKQVRETVTALVGEILRVRRDDPALLDAQLRALRTALDQRP